MMLWGELLEHIQLREFFFTYFYRSRITPKRATIAREGQGLSEDSPVQGDDWALPFSGWHPHSTVQAVSESSGPSADNSEVPKLIEDTITSLGGPLGELWPLKLTNSFHIQEVSAVPYHLQGHGPQWGTTSWSTTAGVRRGHCMEARFTNELRAKTEDADHGPPMKKRVSRHDSELWESRQSIVSYMMHNL